MLPPAAKASFRLRAWVVAAVIFEVTTTRERGDCLRRAARRALTSFWLWRWSSVSPQRPQLGRFLTVAGCRDHGDNGPAQLPRAQCLR